MPFYERIDAPATPAQKNLLKALTAEKLAMKELAGEPVRTVLTAAPGNGQPFGGIKVIADSGWFAARPSGTEDVYKIYAESFRSQAHLRQIQQEAQSAINACIWRLSDATKFDDLQMTRRGPAASSIGWLHPCRGSQRSLALGRACRATAFGGRPHAMAMRVRA